MVMWPRCDPPCLPVAARTCPLWLHSFLRPGTCSRCSCADTQCCSSVYHYLVCVATCCFLQKPQEKRFSWEKVNLKWNVPETSVIAATAVRTEHSVVIKLQWNPATSFVCRFFIYLFLLEKCQVFRRNAFRPLPAGHHVWSCTLVPLHTPPWPWRGAVQIMSPYASLSR